MHNISKPDLGVLEECNDLPALVYFEANEGPDAFFVATEYGGRICQQIEDEEIAFAIRDRIAIIPKLVAEICRLREDLRKTCDSYHGLIEESGYDKDELKSLRATLERVANLAGCKWPTDRLTYPDSEVGKYAATAVRLCEDELREALHG